MVKGSHHTEEQKRKQSEAQKGRIAWNKGKYMSKEHRNKMSEMRKGSKSYFYGKHHSEETKRKISEAKKGRVGAKSSNWQGGLTPITRQIRQSFKYQEWRKKIFIRDNFICQKCGTIGSSLEAHHKKPFSKFIHEVKTYLPLLPLFEGALIYTPLWDISNGITFCKKCHYKFKKIKQ